MPTDEQAKTPDTREWVILAVLCIVVVVLLRLAGVDVPGAVVSSFR